MRLDALASLKASTCYCSECAAELRFRSFTSHPCFKEAVARHGKQKARQLVQRLSHPPGPHLRPAHKRPRPTSMELPVTRDVRPRVAAYDDAREAVLLDDLEPFGTLSSYPLHVGGPYAIATSFFLFLFLFLFLLFTFGNNCLF